MAFPYHWSDALRDRRQRACPVTRQQIVEILAGDVVHTPGGKSAGAEPLRTASCCTFMTEGDTAWGQHVSEDAEHGAQR